MCSNEDVKPQYFANGDFERTVADIISSPRRAKYTTNIEDSLFHITDKQKEYYTKCFKHLLKATQSTVADFLNAALNGADSQVVEFFKRSGLDTDSLSRIWALSDVNEDGWLDVHEFSMAMHLIVLRVKGEVSIPSALPPHIRPARTPSRSNSQALGQLSPAVASSSNPPPTLPTSHPVTSKASQNQVGSWDKFAVPELPLDVIDKADLHLTQFSDVPPLLVDSRPTAVKPTPLPLMLSLKSPSGPPPQPPPRPLQKGHTRSVSLDLKTVTHQGLAGVSLTDRRVSDSTALMTSSLQSVPPPAPPGVRSSNSGPMPVVVPPPVPVRISPPTQRPASKSVETQTVTNKTFDEDAVEQFIQNLGGKLEDLLGAEVAASEGNGVDRWELRCKALRQQNAELELERARLAQVRIQLELRLQEMEDQRQPPGASTTKPTSL